VRPARSTLLLAALALCACATPRRTFGEVDIKSNPPLLNAQLTTSFGFRVEEGRLLLTRPERGGGFDVALTGAGCVRGLLAEHLQEYCPGKSLPEDPPDTVRWRSSLSASSFTTRLLQWGAIVEVESGYNRVAFELPEGAAADELRRHPGLLGLAVAFGVLPAASGERDEAVRSYGFIVAEAGPARK
jgi:hypothetical protein